MPAALFGAEVSASGMHKIARYGFKKVYDRKLPSDHGTLHDDL